MFAGGCALNSLANKRIYESNYFNKIFIPYAPGDGGGSIGQHYFIYLRNTNNRIMKILKSIRRT